MGGGIEWGITPNLSIKGEGLYMSFEDSYRSHWRAGERPRRPA